MRSKTTSGVFKATVGLSAISIISKLLAFAREQFIAWRFGASASVDSYVAAFTAPQLLAGILGGAVAAAFLPVYTAQRAKSEEAGQQLAGTSLLAVVLISGLGSALMLAFAPGVVRLLVGNFPPEQQRLTVQLLRIMSGGVTLLSLSFFLTMLLNSHTEFMMPAMVPVVANVILVLGLIFMGAWGIVGLSVLTALSMALPILLLIWAIYRRGIRVGLHYAFASGPFRKVAALSVPIFASSAFGQVYQLVDRRLASGLDAGSLASLNFAVKLAQLPIAIFVTALVTAVYPTLAQQASEGDLQGYGETVSASLRGVSLLIIPAAVGMFVLQTPIVRLAFERGSFDETATARTAVALGYYAVGILGLAMAQVLARAFYSLQDTLTPVKVGIITATINVALAFILVRPMGHGGLALANSLGSFFNSGMLLFVLSRKLRRGALNFGPLLGKTAVASALMGAGAYGVYGLAASRFGQIISLGAAVGFGMAVYGVMLLIMRVEEVNLVRRRLLRMAGRG